LSSSTIANFHYLKFNTSTANFTVRTLEGNGASASSVTNTVAFGGLDNGGTSTASTFSSTQIYIPNYAGSTNKSYGVETVTETNATTIYSELVAGLWSNTAAITGIEIYPDSVGHTYVQYSTATLYGISKS
jgi:hypothetical protein